MTDAAEQGVKAALPPGTRRRNHPLSRYGNGLFAGGIFFLLALVPIAARMAGQDFFLVNLARILILAIAALSLDFIMGIGGMVSLGHAAFLGIGAYVVAIAAACGITDILVQAALATLACATFAVCTGAISLRTREVYFIMITLAFGQMAFYVANSLSAYGGDNGTALESRSTFFGERFLQDRVPLYYTVLCVLCCTFYLFRRIAGSRFGRVLRGARDNAVRMEAVGFSPFAYRLIAYVIAGIAAGLAGVLLANLTEFVSPAYMSWQRSGELMVMVVLGGMGTLVGAIGGAIVFLLLEDWLSSLSDHWPLALGSLLLILVLSTRGGIAGAFDKAFRTWRS